MKGAQQMDVDDRDALILPVPPEPFALILGPAMRGASSDAIETSLRHMGLLPERIGDAGAALDARIAAPCFRMAFGAVSILAGRSEEHTSELQSLMRISYAVFCLKKKKIKNS